jgi:hypothetical protein
VSVQYNRFYRFVNLSPAINTHAENAMIYAEVAAELPTKYSPNAPNRVRTAIMEGV